MKWIQLGRGVGSVVWLSAIGSALNACSDDKGCTSIGCAPEATPVVQEMAQDNGANAFVDDGPGGPGPNQSTALEDSEVCRAVGFGTEASPVNVHVVLDRSSSMLEPVSADDPNSPSRWDAMTAALRQFVNSPQANGAKVGLQFFGLTNGNDDCSIEKYMTPAVEVGFLADVRNDLLAALDTTRPGSLTPTGPALEGALTHALDMAQLPENEGRATVVVLASDGLPSECFPTDETGAVIASYGEIIDTLERFAEPAEDPAGAATPPPIRTYIVGTEDLRVNARTLAEAGGGQAFLVGGASGANVQADFLDALLSIVVRPLTCRLEIPTTAPDTGEVIDFDEVRVRFTGASSGTAREIPRSTVGPQACGGGDAWYYDDPAQPTGIIFCPNTCSRLGAGDLTIELGCAPVIQ